MLRAFKTHIAPFIEGVYSTQEIATIENESGDTIKVVIDAILKWKGVDVPVIFDFKTAAKAYDEDSVVKSHQLAIYTALVGEKYGTRKCGYIVFNKIPNKHKTKVCELCGYDGSGAAHRTCPEIDDIEKKRCGGGWLVGVNPTCSVQVIIDDMPVVTEELVMSNMDVINKCIHNGLFTKNITNCMTRYNTKCSYYDLCYKNDKSKLHIPKEE